ncbi:MAG: ATP-dependent RNA helicase HrpA [Syntrophus sp. (in: bacteria)]|nr:ATP-dependent RNA helicase HrpA [Syntrophus sp. (in: bacteria)]
MYQKPRQPPPLPRITYPASLPIVARKEDIIRAIRRHSVVVITGETGSGKTTQIPKMCLEAGRGLRGIIGCTQPRRVAAVTVAQRIAEELGEDVGRSVGYKIRFEDRSGPRPLIKLMTDGILLMEAQADPRLRAYDTIIVDEAHERSLNIDFILGILKKLIHSRRDLKMIITSATIDTEKFSRAFDDAPIIEVSGRMYPVEVRYRPLDPDEEEKGDFTYVDAAVRAVDDLKKERKRGDILIFMPSEQDIRETCDLLEGREHKDCAVLPMFARLSWSEQRRVFQPMTQQKIVVATNVAETSITIPGIRYVIDTGMARISRYSPRTRTTSLPIRDISRSSADQRKGRCGRVQHGICIRLYAEEDFENRPLFTPPEILRANLAEVILRMLSLNLGDVETFPFIDPPGPRAVRDGLDLLQELGAVEKGGRTQEGSTESFRLTQSGRRMARLPIDPRISRMILEAQKEGCVEEVLVIASAMTVQDPRERPLEQAQRADQVHTAFRDPTSDFITLLRIWNHYYGQRESIKTQNSMRKFCREHFLSYRRMREWRDVHDQIRMILNEQEGNEKPDRQKPADAQKRTDDIHKSILSGYLSNIAVKQAKNLYTATKGRQVMIFPGSSLFNKGGNWIVAAEIVETSRLFARTAANIDADWLEALGGGLCRYTYAAPHWEKNRGEVVASEQVSIFGLVIVAGRPVSYGRIDPETSARIFVRSALVEGEVKQNLPFLEHNRKLMASVAAMEDKIRRHDLLADEEQIARFYEERLPGIYDVRTLQKLVRDRGGDGFLRMKEADILKSLPDERALALYPDECASGKLRFRFSYRFDPGHPEDGVTMKIPVHLLSRAPAETADRSVPGLYREKINTLLKGLAKEYRKKLQPLAETADVIQTEMSSPEGSLPSALGKFIHQRFGVDIPASAWPLDKLPDHLKLRFSVVDAQGREMAAGRDLSRFRTEMLTAEESAVLAVARKVWEKTGLTQWDFGDLPEEIPLESRGSLHGFAYPVLQAADGSVNIRLFQTLEAAVEVHRNGVMALCSLYFQTELKYLKKSLALTGDMKVWAAAFGGHKILENRLYEKILRDLFCVPVRTAAAFHQQAEAAAPRILPAGQEVLREIKPFVQAYHETVATLHAFEMSYRFNEPAKQFLNSVRADLDRLVPSDFLLQYDVERLGDIVRYLKALVIRTDRGLLHLEKALAKSKEIKPFNEFLQETLKYLTLASSAEKRQALEAFRWMIEEYKVSLFAQELKTPYPISRKRLEEKKREIERMA